MEVDDTAVEMGKGEEKYELKWVKYILILGKPPPLTQRQVEFMPHTSNFQIKFSFSGMSSGFYPLPVVKKFQILSGNVTSRPADRNDDHV